MAGNDLQVRRNLRFDFDDAVDQPSTLPPLSTSMREIRRGKVVTLGTTLDFGKKMIESPSL